jgi:hypothetical protein
VSRSLLSAAVLVGIVGPAVFAAAPPDGPLPSPKVQALIEQMGDRDYRVRDLAEKKLRDEGAAALPQLRKALKHKELEVRRRALRLVPSIETAVLFAPKRVTFSVRNEPIDKVLKALAKASGYQINDNENMGFPVPVQQPNAKAQPKARTFSYDFVNEPFWDAVDRICKDAGLSLQQGYGDDVVRLYKSNGHSPFVARSGPFRVVASNLQAYRNVDLSSSENLHNRSETLTLNFTVWAEPRLPLMNAGEARLDSAYDDLKNSLVPRRDLNVDLFDGPFGFRGRGGFRGGRFYSGGYKQLALPVSVALERRSERATVLKVVKGVVPMTVLVKQEPIVLSDKILSAKGVKKEVGDLTFEIQEVKKAGANQVTVKFSITNKKTNDYSWQNNLYNRLELFDDKGNKYQNWGSSWGSSGPGGVQMTLTLSNGSAAKPGEPAKFAFIHWETKQYDVEFTFRDVPLP